MPKLIDLTGKRFGKLTVLERAEDHTSKNGNKRPAWKCRCDCGIELVVMGLNLSRNHTTSCGCARQDGRKKLMLDVTNQRFGKLVALHHEENEKKGTYWLFHCDCGNEKVMLLQNVITGKSTSCGMCKKMLGITRNTESGIRGISFDLTGQRFDRLLAVERIVDGKMVKYRCLCDCGNECIKSSFSLLYVTKRQGTNSCGCIRIEKARKASLEGKKFNHLTVIKKAEKKYGKLHWLCKCDCGKETIVSSSGLLSGHTKSCGCYQDIVASDKHLEDLTGRRFGMLTVLHRVENDSRGNVQYLCRCDCGNEKVVRGAPMVHGLTLSCGCFAQSVGEMYISDALCEMGLNSEAQMRFPDLTGIGGMELSYDFGVFDEFNELLFLIEYQGEQHYRSVEYFGGEAQFEKQQFHDELKREYAKDYLGVPLLEIPFSIREYKGVHDMIYEFYNGIKLR